MRRSACWLVLALGCGPVEPSVTLDAPRNTCTVDSCSEGSCVAGRCEVTDPGDYALVLSMADSAYYAPGVTFVLGRADVIAQASKAGASTCPGQCLSTPYVSRVSGRYLVDANVVEELGGRLVDGAGANLAQAQVPVSAIYRYLLPDSNGTLTEATALGLPIADVLTSVLPDDAARAAGVGGGNALVTRAIVGPGQYQVEMQVQASLRSMLPPRLATYDPQNDGTSTNRADDTFQPAAVDPVESRTTTIASSYRSLAGYRAYLTDASGRTISRTVTLDGAQNRVFLATFGQQQPNGTLPTSTRLVLAPPEDTLGVPTLRIAVLAGSLNAPAYPELPTPSSLEGTVTAADGTGVKADLDILATGVVNLRDHLTEDSLTYVTRLSTDDRGRFATVLPEGTYHVFVDPDPASGMSRRDITLQTRGAQTGTPSGARTTWTVPVDPKTRVTGRAIALGGPPLDAVDVWFRPSVPRITDSAYELPRPITVRTDASGTFSADLDSGYYDFTITPVSGTGFAPYVRSNQLIPRRAGGTCTIALGDVAVHVPQVLAFTLRDPINSAVPPPAWARLFARPAGSEHYVELQRELTDSSGYVRLLFRQPDYAPNSPFSVCQ